MQIPIPDRLLNEAQLRGCAQRLMSTKVGCRPARPLEAAEVVMMEKGMADDIDPIYKYMLGAVLFCLYSRSRWSDIQHLDTIWVTALNTMVKLLISLRQGQSTTRLRHL